LPIIISRLVAPLKAASRFAADGVNGLTPGHQPILLTESRAKVMPNSIFHFISNWLGVGVPIVAGRRDKSTDRQAGPGAFL